MKFLHEMIAKKRSQQAGEPVHSAEADPTEARVHGDEDLFVLDAGQQSEPDAVHEDQDAEFEDAAEEPLIAEVDEPVADEDEDDEGEDWSDEDALAAEFDDDDAADEDEDDQDDEDLFDDGSYDWDLEDAESQEIPEEVAPAAMAHPDFSRLPAGGAQDETVDDEDDEDDVRRGVSMVLKDLAARSETAEPKAEAPAEEPERERVRSSVEENVEKLRIQRKIWDMDSTAEAEEEPASAEADSDPEPEPEYIPRTAAPMPPLRLHESQQTAPPMPRRVQSEPEAPAAEAAPQPQAQPRRAGRVKTRLLGFHKTDEAAHDPFAAPQKETVSQGEPQFPVGWMVVMKGPGRGASFTLTAGASKIGRGEDQAIRLDFGDTSISRDNHAAVAYDEEHHCFYIGHGGKANLVRLNDMPVLSTEQLADGDEIRIGETTLRFVAFCGPEFSWEQDEDGEGRYAAAE